MYISQSVCLKVYLSKCIPLKVCISQNVFQCISLKVCISQSVPFKVSISISWPDLMQILPRDSWWGGASLYSSSMDLASGSAGSAGGLAKEKDGLKLDCLVQGNITRNHSFIWQPNHTFQMVQMDHSLDHYSLKTEEDRLWKIKSFQAGLSKCPLKWPSKCFTIVALNHIFPEQQEHM